MLDQSLKNPNVEHVTFLHCVRNDNNTPFKDHLTELAKNNPKLELKYWKSDEHGRISSDEIKKLQKDRVESDIYCVGPEGLMGLAKNNVKPNNRFKFEFFGPLGNI